MISEGMWIIVRERNGTATENSSEERKSMGPAVAGSDASNIEDGHGVDRWDAEGPDGNE